MAMKISEELRAKAEVYNGDEMCQEKTKLLLKEVGLPNGLLPLKNIIECGYIEETGFVWLKQKKKIDHLFEKIGRVVSYAPEITAYAEKSKIRKVTGVKAKELLIWITINEISVDDPPTGKLVCKSTAGLYRTFPTSAFEVPEKKEKEKDKEKDQDKEKEKEKDEDEDKDKDKDKNKEKDKEEEEKEEDKEKEKEEEEEVISVSSDTTTTTTTTSSTTATTATAITAAPAPALEKAPQAVANK